MNQQFTDEQVAILNQLTQEDVDYVKERIVAQKRANKLSHQEYVNNQDLVQRVKCGNLTSEERAHYEKYGIYDPDSETWFNPPQVSEVLESHQEIS